jgi:Tol biopolymer transport system component
MASVSPDGTRIAYWTWPFDPGDGTATSAVPLTVAVLDGSGPLTILDGVDPPISTVEGRPQWSPDGQSLVFGAGGTLYRVIIETRELTTITDDGRFRRAAPILSPDGEWLAVHVSPIATEPTMRPLGAVHILRADGSEETVVSGEAVAWGGNFGPSWSADSRRLAFVTPETVVDPESREYTVPDGIAISARGASGWTTMSVAGVEGIDDQVMLDWAPRGERVAYMAIGEPTPDGLVPSVLMVVEPDGTLRQLTTELLGQGFCWSPDATRIAAMIFDRGLVALDVETGAVVADFGIGELNVGDACVWSAWAGEPR